MEKCTCQTAKTAFRKIGFRLLSRSGIQGLSHASLILSTLQDRISLGKMTGWKPRCYPLWSGHGQIPLDQPHPVVELLGLQGQAPGQVAVRVSFRVPWPGNVREAEARAAELPRRGRRRQARSNPTVAGREAGRSPQVQARPQDVEEGRADRWPIPRPGGRPEPRGSPPIPIARPTPGR